MRVYRPAPWIAGFGGISTGLFACVFLAHAVVFSLNDPTPRGPGMDLLVVACCFGVWGTMTLLSLYVLAAGLTERIIVEGMRITFIGPICKQTIDLRDVTRVRWRNNDSVKLYAGRCRQSLWFAGSRLEDAGDLIKLIRNNVPAALQEGWHPFFQARMKGRYDGEQHFRLIHPRAKRLPQPVNRGRLIAVSFCASLLVALAGWGMIEWELRKLPSCPPSPFTGNWLCDWLLIGVFAATPTLLIFLPLGRDDSSRNQTLAAPIEGPAP